MTSLDFPSIGEKEVLTEFFKNVTAERGTLSSFAAAEKTHHSAAGQQHFTMRRGQRGSLP